MSVPLYRMHFITMFYAWLTFHPIPQHAVAMATEKLLDMSSSNTGPQTVTRSHDHRSRSHDHLPMSHDREWPVLNHRKSQVGSNIRSTPGNHERSEVNRTNRKVWNQKGQGYPDGNRECEAGGSAEDVMGSPPFYPSGIQGPSQGASFGREFAGGSRVGPGHGPGFFSGHGPMNRYPDYYPSDIGMGRNTALRPFGPGMGFGYDFYTGSGMGNGMYHQVPRYYHDNQFMMGMMGRANGPHPPMHRAYAPYPVMKPSSQYPRQPPTSPSSQGARMNRRAEIDHHDMWVGSTGHGYSQKPHPSHNVSEPPYSNYQNVPRDKRPNLEDRMTDKYTSERKRERSEIISKYPPPSRSQSAEEVVCVGNGRSKKKMILLRGLPGSGKSTLAKYV